MIDEPMKYMRAEKRKMESELEPYINGIRTMTIDSVGFGMFAEAYAQYKERYERYSRVVRYFSKGMLKVTENPKDRMQWILYYLGLLEGINNTTLNILIMLLKANQNQRQIIYLTNSSRIKYAGSLDDLEGKFISLSAKIRFLKANGLKEVASLIDTKLRNDVAHFRFNVADDEIYMGESKAMPLVADGILKLEILFDIVHECLGILNTQKGMDKQQWVL